MIPYYAYNPILDEQYLLTLDSIPLRVKDKKLNFRNVVLTSHRIIVFRNIWHKSFFKELLRSLTYSVSPDKYTMEYEILLEDIVDIRKVILKNRKPLLQVTHFTGRVYLFDSCNKLYDPLKKAVLASETMDTIPMNYFNRKPLHYVI